MCPLLCMCARAHVCVFVITFVRAQVCVFVIMFVHARTCVFVSGIMSVYASTCACFPSPTRKAICLSGRACHPRICWSYEECMRLKSALSVWLFSGFQRSLRNTERVRMRYWTKLKNKQIRNLCSCVCVCVCVCVCLCVCVCVCVYVCARARTANHTGRSKFFTNLFSAGFEIRHPHPLFVHFEL